MIKIIAVYAIYVGDKMYIGATKNYVARMWKHLNLLKLGKHPIKPLQEDYDSGLTLRYKILSNPEEENLYEEEKHFIGTYNPEYNTSKGGIGGATGVKRSQQFKEKLRAANLGERNPMFGRRGKDNPRSIPVQATHAITGETIFFDSIMDGAEFVKGDFSSIAAVCKKGLHKVRYGYYWEYTPVSTIAGSGE